MLRSCVANLVLCCFSDLDLVIGLGLADGFYGDRFRRRGSKFGYWLLFWSVEKLLFGYHFCFLLFFLLLLLLLLLLFTLLLLFILLLLFLLFLLIFCVGLFSSEIVLQKLSLMPLQFVDFQRSDALKLLALRFIDHSNSQINLSVRIPITLLFFRLNGD